MNRSLDWKHKTVWVKSFEKFKKRKLSWTKSYGSARKRLNHWERKSDDYLNRKIDLIPIFRLTQTGVVFKGNRRGLVNSVTILILVS